MKSQAVPLIEKFQMEEITLVMIEHRLGNSFVSPPNHGAELRRKADRGHPDQVMEDERVKEAYLGSQRCWTLSKFRVQGVQDSRRPGKLEC